MKLLVVGGGGREHAIIKSLKKNPQVETIYALPGNGGMAKDAVCTGIGATDIDSIVAFAKENAIDYAVVAPDDPLVLGCVDRLNEVGIPCFGPKANAAIIEGSKAFAKENLPERETISDSLIEAAIGSPARISVIPMQDILNLDGSARMNTPGTVGGSNWRWRMEKGALTDELAEKYHELNEFYERI